MGAFFVAEGDVNAGADGIAHGGAHGPCDAEGDDSADDSGHAGPGGRDDGDGDDCGDYDVGDGACVVVEPVSDVAPPGESGGVGVVDGIVG